MKREARENMLHVDEGLLHAYLDGELAGAERDQVLGHLHECVTCRTRLEEERALVARAGELLQRVAPPAREPPAFALVKRPHAPSWRVPAAWAATVTIAFAVGWYAQGKRLAHEVGARATQSESRAPAPITDVPPAAVAKTTEPVRPHEDDAGQRAADVATAPAAPAAQAGALRDDAAAWPALDAAAARALLGQAPAVLRGHAVRRMARSPGDDGVVLVEQEWRPGIVLRLYERRAMTADRVDATQPSPQRARVPPGALALRQENLARYVRSLRVEIAGPMAPDSLAQILDSLESSE